MVKHLWICVPKHKQGMPTHKPAFSHFSLIPPLWSLQLALGLTIRCTFTLMTLDLSAIIPLYPVSGASWPTTHTLSFMPHPLLQLS